MARDRARQVAVNVIAIAIAWSVGSGAQSLGPPPTFRADIDYVRIPVRVLDARGEFVRGLTQADFEGFEDGVLQTITTFAGVDIPLAPLRPADATPSDAQPPYEQPQAAGRVYVFVLDNRSMDCAAALRVRQLVRRFMSERLGA